MTDITQADYLFDNSTDAGLTHMEMLSAIFDRHSIQVLERTGLRAGARCLDVGAGSGSISRWLADRVAPGGAVTALDIDTSRMSEHPGVRIRRHDLDHGLHGDLAGPYDLIHARLLLTHLPRRHEILRELVDALAPGGWLVIGDMTDRPLGVLSEHSARDIAVWERIQHLSHEVVSPAGGIDFGWARRIDAAMVGAGLEELHGIEVSETVDGGSPGALLHASLNAQAARHLLDAGADPWEMERYQELTRDPTFRSWFYQFICCRGRKPF
ncbi:class I SAM-dependent methyltransferase [Brachybacterium fresconis]|uniref:SAM-dependent methyltransferase n=1 Tax=Brachybacterium fresconis TaxID=173363 RepID=A0ABS4YHG5_9MICO|nr:class I SAM-dependent methyltransferase [Brachybacterium fresconis]MBP2408236.1 SAM-dependent methyltransferase [Brachybacterium fresconis]